MVYDDEFDWREAQGALSAPERRGEAEGSGGAEGADAPARRLRAEQNTDWSFDLGDNVGSRETNDRQDVIKVETLLGNNDYLDLSETDGPTGYWGTRTEDAVKDYQRDSGLTVDGWLAPGGETITSLKGDLGDFMADAKPATPELVDDHHDRLDRGEDGALNLDRHDFELKSRDDLPELGAESEASNHRLAQAIHRSGDLGEVPTYIADAAQTDGAKAIAEAHDLMNRLGSERGRELAQAVVAKLPPEHQQAFVGGPVSERQPLGVGYDMLHKPTEEDIKKNPELAGGLGGEIAGMKKDAEDAHTLTGGSGEDDLSADGSSRSNGGSIWARVRDERRQPELDRELGSLDKEKIAALPRERRIELAAYIADDSDRAARHQETLRDLYGAMKTEPEYTQADVSRRENIAATMKSDPAIQKVNGRWTEASEEDRKKAMEATIKATLDGYGVKDKIEVRYVHDPEALKGGGAAATADIEKGTIAVNTASNKWQQGYNSFDGGHVLKTGVEEAVHIAQSDLINRRQSDEGSLSEAERRQADQFDASLNGHGLIKGRDDPAAYHTQPHERHAKEVTDWIDQWSTRRNGALFKNR